MGVYQTKAFARFARKEGLENGKLLKAAMDASEGRFDADLGGGLFKQRVARSGGGKSGGFRTILACKRGGHCFFLHGFSKSEKANVSTRELRALERLADHLFSYAPKQIAEALNSGELLETGDDDKDAKD